MKVSTLVSLGAFVLFAAYYSRGGHTMVEAVARYVPAHRRALVRIVPLYAEAIYWKNRQFLRSSRLDWLAITVPFSSVAALIAGAIFYEFI